MVETKKNTGNPDLGGCGAVAGNSGAIAREQALPGVELPSKRSPGRPKGSSTEIDKQLKKLILHDIYEKGQKTPLEHLVSVYSMKTEEAIAAGCAFKDVLKVQVAAATQAAQYFHAKMPQEISVDGQGTITMGLFINGTDPAAFQGGKLQPVPQDQWPDELRRAIEGDIEDADFSEVSPEDGDE